MMKTGFKYFTLLLLFLAVTGNVIGQDKGTVLFYDDFGAPGSGVEQRKIWPYMPVGINTFVFAHPDAKNLGGKDFSEAKAIENNFYAVVSPKKIYESAGDLSATPPYTAPVYQLWTTLDKKGDATEGHNGNGGAMVINAGTTAAAFYVRIANLDAGKYYRLRYKLFVQNTTVKIDHHVLSANGGTSVAVYEGENNGQGTGTGEWKQQDYWFFMPETCTSGNYTISIQNANKADGGNDFAIDDILFEEYEPEVVDQNIKDKLPESAKIKCGINEPVANDDEKTMECNNTEPVTIPVLDNDKNESGTEGSMSAPDYQIRLDVPVGAKHEIKGNAWDIPNSTEITDQVTVHGQGVWEVKETRVLPPWGSTAPPRYTDVTFTFTPVSGFTGNPSPISYRVYNRKTGAGSNRAFVHIFSDCNPRAVDDTKEVPAIVPEAPIEIEILENDYPAGVGDKPSVKPEEVEKVTLINPNTLISVKNGPMTVDGEGDWEYKEGKLIFTPVAGFTKEPTPIQYTFTEKGKTPTETGKTSNPAKVTIKIGTPPAMPEASDDTKEMTPGEPVEINILDNDKLSNNEVPKPNEVTVKLIDPKTEEPVSGNNLTVEDQGTWIYDSKTGILTFTPNTGFTGIPTPINYTIMEDGKESNEAKVTITLKPVVKNYWHGTEDNAWANKANWTANKVPEVGEDIVFATEDNNGTAVPDNPKSGPAIKDLYLDDAEHEDGGVKWGRVIKNLINDSEKDLIVTTGNSLLIQGEVKDGNESSGTIIVKADPEDLVAGGTLKFADPSKNKEVKATVEFYNQAYVCEACGIYRNSWQYFGIPVKESNGFPVQAEDKVTVNQWVEPYNGNKWQQAPFTPDTQLKAFKGYQITDNNATDKPETVYSFQGELFVGDATVSLSKTGGVNYEGVNIVGNSFTAAIPIDEDVLKFSDGVEKMVYLFNTGTRDQWRKSNGAETSGLQAGRYLAVPVGVSGQAGLPSMIPSMHSFLVIADEKDQKLEIAYSGLVKNELITDAEGKKIATRSAVVNNKGGSGTLQKQQLPALVMDVIGEESADRVWIFAKEGTSAAFDNGWDGRKMSETGMAQLYVQGSDESVLQVATMADLNEALIGFKADQEGKFRLEFSLSGQLKGAELFLHDRVTGETVAVTDGGSYGFTAGKADIATRFSLSYEGNSSVLSADEALLEVTVPDAGSIKVTNGSNNSCSVFISGINGNVEKRRIEVEAKSEVVIDDLAKGTYMVRLQNAVVNDVRRIALD